MFIIFIICSIFSFFAFSISFFFLNSIFSPCTSEFSTANGHSNHTNLLRCHVEQTEWFYWSIRQDRDSMLKYDVKAKAFTLRTLILSWSDMFLSLSFLASNLSCLMRWVAQFKMAILLHLRNLPGAKIEYKSANLRTKYSRSFDFSKLHIQRIQVGHNHVEKHMEIMPII